jgi:hypothetical protein
MFITLRENADVERTSTDRTYKTSDVDEAVRAVREFLTSFVAASRTDLMPQARSAPYGSHQRVTVR